MYKDLKKLYDETQTIVFNMAITHLVDIGHRNALEITDKDIEELEGNGLMTKEFVQALVRISRDIARVSTPTQILQFAQVQKLYDTKLYKQGK